MKGRATSLGPLPLLLIVLVSACSERPSAPPRPLSVNPEVGLLGEPTELTILGEGFLLELRSGLSGAGSATTVGRFTAYLGPHALETVTWKDASTLGARVPGTIPEGTYDLMVTDPRGRVGTLESAFTVVEPPIFLTLETERRGEGRPVGNLALRLDETFTLHATLRDRLGLFLSNPVVDWSTEATVATVSPVHSNHTVLTARVAGATVVRGVLDQPALSAQADLQVMGECSSDPQCAHPCYSSARCEDGRCIQGPVDKDSDGDGRIDGACTGGTDCDDDPAACGADCFPGNRALDGCDGLDQDCDGRTDEDFAPLAITCGVGACAGNTGTTTCSAGSPSDSCDPLAGAASNDATCDGLDDDCDGSPDEDFVPGATSCGTGACAGNTGTTTCSAGSPIDSCDPLTGAAPDDATCDGLDDDCDGATDEDFVELPTSCGVGACAGQTGVFVCNAGTTTDTCDPQAGASPDTSCNGIDEDCDGVDYLGNCCPDSCSACTGGTGACCSDTCTSSPCIQTCSNGCSCEFDCSGGPLTCSTTCDNDSDCHLNCDWGGSCKGLCDGGSRCDFDLTRMTNAEASCANGSTCDIDCTGSGSCAVTCDSGSSCDIDCSSVSICRDNDCTQGAQCLLNCTNTNPQCQFRTCEGGEQSCPGDIVACNRACP